ncbi:hypothetical protein GQR58_011377 [Nymphon striatum]|nr:hypothetical protein GQR58_011377 [Nymphon striatum]
MCVLNYSAKSSTQHNYTGELQNMLVRVFGPTTPFQTHLTAVFYSIPIVANRRIVSSRSLMLKHLPDCSLALMLNIFNTIWITGAIPDSYHGYHHIYTDGSRQNDEVAAAAISSLTSLSINGTAKSTTSCMPSSRSWVNGLLLIVNHVKKSPFSEFLSLLRLLKRNRRNGKQNGSFSVEDEMIPGENEVYTRLNCSNDLVADEGRYHRMCLQRFMINKRSPDAEVGEKGRPVDEGMQQWFQMLCIWLEVEADAELYTLQELHKKMAEIAGDEDIYGDMISYFLHDLWNKERTRDEDREAEIVVLTAAKLIMSEIREKEYDPSVYPKSERYYSSNRPLGTEPFKTVSTGFDKV